MTNIPSTITPLDEQIISQLFAIGRATRKRMLCTVHDAVQLSPVHYATLRFIDEHGAPLMKDVAHFLAIAPPSLTPMINALEKHGFVTRKRKDSDRRSVCVTITQDGKRALTQILAQNTTHIRAMLAHLTTEEKRQLANILEKLSTHPPQ